MDHSGPGAALLLAMVVAFVTGCGAATTGPVPGTPVEVAEPSRPAALPTPAATSPLPPAHFGSLRLGSATLSFEVTFCGFDPEASGNRAVRFGLQGSGTHLGRPFAIEAAAVTDALAEVQWIEVRFSPDMRYVSISQSGEPGWPLFALDSDTLAVTGAGEFVLWRSTAQQPAGTGILAASCPPFAEGQSPVRAGPI